MNIYEHVEQLLLSSSGQDFRRDALIHASYHGDAGFVRFLLPFIKPVSDIAECGALQLSIQIGHEEVTEVIQKYLAQEQKATIQAELGDVSDRASSVPRKKRRM